MRQVLILFLVCCLAPFVIAKGVIANKQPPRLSEASKARVLMTLREDCANCHGLYRLGGLGPALTPERLKVYPVEALALIIEHGRPGNFMPPWKDVLSKEEIDYLANYLLTVEPTPPEIQMRGEK